MERWKYFQKACSLVGEFYGLKPLIIANFPETTEDIEFLQSKYQDWRRLVQADRPILQDVNGQSEEAYRELRERYNQVVRNMLRKI
jgi:hypothetical protein